MEIEGKLQEFESRLSSLETTQQNLTPSHDKDKTELLTQYQQQILPKLILIRDKIMNEEGGNIDQIKGERDQAIKENILLRKEIEKLNYRVNHLVKALNEEEQKHA